VSDVTDGVQDGLVERNRANAMRSTGPRTPAGRERSSRNSLKHGIFAKCVVLPDLDSGESAALFRDLHGALVEDLQPASELEALVVERIAAIHWRLRRVYRAETAEIEHAQEVLGWSPLRRDADKFDEVKRFGTLGLGIGSILESPSAMHFALELLDEAAEEVTESGVVSERTQKRLARVWGTEDDGFVEAVVTFSVAATSDDPDLDPARCKVALEYALTHERERLASLKQIAEERRDSLIGSSSLAALVPPEGPVDRIIRYEAHLERQLGRALDQLDRLQRSRRGEVAPPTLRLEHAD